MSIHDQCVFIPSVRQGLATEINSSANSAGRAQIDIELDFGFGPDNIIPNQVFLYGPGDVTGFHPRIVVRTDPPHNSDDFESNYFPAIDFGEPDFLWRFTPAQADPAGKLTPWLTLIVLLAEDLPAPEGLQTKEFKEQWDGNAPCRWIEVNIEHLPDLNEAWRWAHVQSATEDNLSGAISRLICPRRLRPGARYSAFVVPTFMLGRKAGLPKSSLPERILAWELSDSGTGEKIPYYYKWEFRTSEMADFQHLITLLQPRTLPKLGTRDLDCSNPGFGLQVVREDLDGNDPDYHILGLEGALKAPETEFTPWGNDRSINHPTPLFQNQLKEIFKVPLRNTPVVGPPIYGRWHAARNSVSPGNRAWIDELNLDPRHRVAAGLGAEVVKKQQEELMASAWNQLGDVLTLNELVRHAQFGSESSWQLYQRLGRLSTGEFMRISAAIHGRVLINDQTIHAYYKSQVPEVILEPTYRRVAKMRGSIRKRQEPAAVFREQYDTQFQVNCGRKWEITISGYWIAAIELQKSLDNGYTWTRLRVFDSNGAYNGTEPEQCLLRLTCTKFTKGNATCILKTDFPGTWQNPNANRINVDFKINMTDVLSKIRNEEFRPVGSHPSPGGAFHVNEIIHIQTPVNPGGVPGAAELINHIHVESSSQNSIIAGAVINTLGGGGWRRNSKTVRACAPGKSNPVLLEEIHRLLNDYLEPEKAFLKMARSSLDSLAVPAGCGENLGMAMAYPEFHQPMYQPLRDTSADLLLPGFDTIPRNTVAILETNLRFVEAYMCGLNHELAGELLWREYPTDQRGSYFRQFWDVSNYVSNAQELDHLLSNFLTSQGVQAVGQLPKEQKRLILFRNHETLDDLKDMTEEKKASHLEELLKIQLLAEKLRDITPLTHWEGRGLGINRNQSRPEEKLVLLIKGDLILKYRNPVIFAVNATPEGKPGSTIMRPVFSGSLGEDTIFVGLEMSVNEACGQAEHPDGWYIGIEERLSGVHFGLNEGKDNPVEPFNSWEELSWRHIPDIQYGGYIHGASLPSPENPEDLSWNCSSAEIACITLQKPVRMFIHVRKLLRLNPRVKITVTKLVVVGEPNPALADLHQVYCLLAIRDGSKSFTQRIPSSGVYDLANSVTKHLNQVIYETARVEDVLRIVAAIWDQDPGDDDFIGIDRIMLSTTQNWGKGGTYKLECRYPGAQGHLDVYLKIE